MIRRVHIFAGKSLNLRCDAAVVRQAQAVGDLQVFKVALMQGICLDLHPSTRATTAWIRRDTTCLRGLSAVQTWLSAKLFGASQGLLSS